MLEYIREYTVLRIREISKKCKNTHKYLALWHPVFTGFERYLLVAETHRIVGGKPSMYRRSAISTLSFSHILTLVYIRVAYIQDGTKPG